MKQLNILGYGEDFLTLWAITKKIDEILSQLDDKTNLEKCKILFRPSFGRAGGIDSAQFGEFDVIIITQNKAYLVESKWDRSKIQNNTLRLDKVQIFRHKILHWYHEHWQGGTWKTFVDKHREEFKTELKKPIAPVNSLLSRNLMTVLNTIRGREIVDVLLFLNRGDVPDFEVDPFKPVVIQYKPKCGNFSQLLINY